MINKINEKIINKLKILFLLRFNNINKNIAAKTKKIKD